MSCDNKEAYEEADHYKAIALRHRNTIKRLKAEMEIMRQQHHKDLARAAKVAREREKKRALKQVFGWETK